MNNEDKIDLMKKLLQEGKTNEEIIELMNFNTYSGMKSFCYRNKINISFYRTGKAIKVNEYSDYMKDLNFLYYLSGFIASDGTIEDVDRNRIRIGLNKKDVEILDKFKNKIFINPETVNMYERENGKRVDGTTKESVCLSISDSELVSFVKSIGMTKNKTETLTILYDKIPEQYIADFIRGYFDGDGSITVSEYVNTGKQYMRSRFIGNKHTMENIYNILICNGIECRIKDITEDKYSFPFFQIEISTNENNIKFYEYIYSNDDCVFLKRKKDKFETVICKRIDK